MGRPKGSKNKNKTTAPASDVVDDLEDLFSGLESEEIQEEIQEETQEEPPEEEAVLSKPVTKKTSKKTTTKGTPKDTTAQQSTVPGVPISDVIAYVSVIHDQVNKLAGHLASTILTLRKAEEETNNGDSQ